jgi:integrase/recombinase XerD
VQALTACRPSSPATASRPLGGLFTANIRNRNTRTAYAQAVTQFFDWCTTRKIHDLGQIHPVLIAAYIEELSASKSAPTVKQRLAPSIRCCSTTWLSARWCL